jgi:hypothetical protein
LTTVTTPKEKRVFDARRAAMRLPFGSSKEIEREETTPSWFEEGDFDPGRPLIV